MNTAARIGRPPGPHDDTLTKLLPVALHLFIEEGGASLTPTRLHRETGIARATIYRNWPDPADLIEILLATAIEQPPGDQFQGDLRRDLHTAMDLLRQQFEERPVRALFAACLEYGRRSERVATTAQSFLAGIVEPFRAVLRAGLEQGALSGRLDELLSEVTGGVLVEHVLLGRRVSRARGRAVVDHFLDHHLITEAIER